MFRAFVLATALALASVGTASAQDAGRSNLEAAQAAIGRSDYAEAARQYRMAADQDNAVAQLELGHMYYNGLGVPQDTVEAYKWLSLAAHQGSFSWEALEDFIASNWMTDETIAEGERLITAWYRMAANRGYPRAQKSVGDAYYTGDGVPLNYVEAVRWYRMAADQGQQSAQGTLGFMYYLGRGVPQNDVEAYKWSALSAAQGGTTANYTISVARLEELRRRMTPAQIAEGQRLAAAWRPR